MTLEIDNLKGLKAYDQALAETIAKVSGDVYMLESHRFQYTSGVEHARGLAKQYFPEEPLPAIPQYVADAIVEYKTKEYSLGDLLGGIEWNKFIPSDKVDANKIFDWVFIENHGTQLDIRQELIAEAWIKGKWDIIEERVINVTFRDSHGVTFSADVTVTEAEELADQIEEQRE